jgi:hypothetical protein
MVIFADPLNEVAVPVPSPEIPIVLAVCSVVAVEELPVKAPVMPPFAAIAPVNVDDPVTPKVPAIVVSPVDAVTTNLVVLTVKLPDTPKVPEMVVLPLEESTKNVVIGVEAPFVILKNSVAADVEPDRVIPPLNVAKLVTSKVEDKFVAPVTPRVEDRVVAPVTPSVEDSVVDAETDNEPVNVAAEVAGLNTNLSRPPLVLTLKIPPFIVIFDDEVTLLLNVAGDANVLVALTVNVSDEASPSVEFPFAISAPVSVVTPVTPRVDDRFVAPVTPRVPVIVAFVPTLNCLAIATPPAVEIDALLSVAVDASELLL